MFDTDLLGLNSRLSSRYMTLVDEHLSPAFRGAAGLRSLPGTASPMAATQAAWRFLKHPEISLRQLFAPLLSSVVGEIGVSCDRYVLVACDWCNLHYTHHSRKRDRVTLSQKKDFGYELFSGLALSDRDGQALGPLWMEMRASDGLHSTHCDQLRPAISVLDELAHNFYFTQQLDLPVSPVFIIDAEADSASHMRQCDRSGNLFLFRADAINSARHGQEQQKLSAIADSMRDSGAFQFARKVKFKQHSVEQWVAHTDVVLTRAARPQRQGEKRQAIPGEPLPLRLIVSELRNQAGERLAIWYLLTNVPESISSHQIVLWYYWRWQIENYHKLLKSAGQEIEHWQQKTAEAIVRRLAIASMACVIVWRLQKDESPEAEQLRNLLVRLSGRQMAYGKKHTAPALLAGFGVLLSMLDILETYDVESLKEIAKSANHWARPGPQSAVNSVSIE